MKWVDKKIKTNLAVWIPLLLINLALCIWLCSVIEIIGNEVLLPTNSVVGKEFWFYESTLKLWKSVYMIVIFTATGMLIASGLVTILITQPQRLVKKVKLKDKQILLKENDNNPLEKPTVAIKN